MRKPILLLTALLFFNNYLFAQNSMVGDGFGGRGWYKAHNYQVGAYSAYSVCGDSNQLYGWGRNRYGELGNGTNVSASSPVAVIGMSNVQFYTTGYVSAVIKNDGTAWVWGGWTSGPAISGFSNTPVQLLSNVKFADGGMSHVVFVKDDHTVWGAGNNGKGELGNGTISNNPRTTPVQMSGIDNAVRAVAIGGTTFATTMILLADSTVKITGGGGIFQLTNSTIPVKLEGLSKIIDIKGNHDGAYALNSEGEVYSIGRAYLGYENPGFDLLPPGKITFPAGSSSIVALSANNDGAYCMALDTNRNVYCWGLNAHGQFGDGTTDEKVTPVLVATNVIDIFAGENFSYILKADSTLWAAGESGYGAASDGSIWMNLPNIQRNVFTQINPLIPPMNLCAPKVWGVVPIKLSNFTCVANGNTAYLNWQSAEETNASKYIVQYSNDGISFKDIATVFATGSNSKYNYIHQQVSGTAFYRLMMMDKDGSFSFSEIRAIKFNSKSGITITPNPSNSTINIFTKNTTSIKTLQLISYDGRIIQTISNYNSGQQINIAGLSSGTYIIKAIYGNHDVAYARFIKN